MERYLGTDRIVLKVRVMHYLDLPVLVRQPSSTDIRSALLALEPDEATNFDTQDALDRGTRQWLSRLACAELSWLPEDEAEEFRTIAARRVAQECGVTASAQRTRNVTLIPGDQAEENVVRLREPGMTEDQLGKLTWGSSLILAQRLARTTSLVSGKACIELGAGTGLCAIAAARLGATHVHATDLPEIVPNLRKNVELNNMETICESYVLDWSSLPTEAPPDYDVCIVSDPVYSRDHPPLLLAAVGWVSAPIVLLQLPLRQGFESERQQIYDGLSQSYTQLEFEEETGRDLFGEQRFAFSKWIRK